jgi:hypothetical protein
MNSWSSTYVRVICPAHYIFLHLKNLTTLGDRDLARSSSFAFFCFLFWLLFFRVQIKSSSPYPRTPSILWCHVTTLSYTHKRQWKKDMCTFHALHSYTEKGKQKITDQILRKMYSLNLIFSWYLHSSNVLPSPPPFYCLSQWENITRKFMVV